MINKIEPINAFNDIPKYHKKKDQSSKSSKKSKHKHEYLDCLLIEKGSPHKASYCKICGKITGIHLFETEKLEDGSAYCRVLDHDEIFEIYKGLKKFEVNSILDQYVNLE